MWLVDLLCICCPSVTGQLDGLSCSTFLCFKLDLGWTAVCISPPPIVSAMVLLTELEYLQNLAYLMHANLKTLLFRQAYPDTQKLHVSYLFVLVTADLNNLLNIFNILSL